MKTARLFDVADRPVVVTGGVSGIGLAIARAFDENGARVTVADIDARATEAALAGLGPEAMAEVVDIGDGGMRDPAVREVFAPQSPLRRVADASEVARAALFFGSDASNWVTRAEIVVDGGSALSGPG